MYKRSYVFLRTPNFYLPNQVLFFFESMLRAIYGPICKCANLLWWKKCLNVSNVYPNQSRITFYTLLWDTLYYIPGLMIGKIFFLTKFLEGKARFSLDFFIVYKLLHLFDWEGLIFRNPYCTSCIFSIHWTYKLCVFCNKKPRAWFLYQRTFSKCKCKLNNREKPHVYMHLIFEKSSLKNQVRRTLNFEAYTGSKNQV